MMSPNVLKQKKVKSITIKDVEYFDVADIKSNHYDLKVNVKKMITIDGVLLIKAEDISSLTDFDNKIKGIFKPKK